MPSKSSLAIVSGLLLLTACASREVPSGRRPIVDPRPVRALWVDAWGAGLNSAEQCDDMIDWARQAGFNTLIVQVRKVGDACYSSDSEPRAIDETSGSRDTLAWRFDPLGYVCAKAKVHEGLRVEAWLVANRVWILPHPLPHGSPSHLLIQHPEWTLIDKDGGGVLSAQGEKASIFTDPSDHRARVHLARVAADVVRRYDVDAVHLDYIRYPGRDWGYGERSLRRFYEQAGRDQRPLPKDEGFTAWRADEVNDQVREVRAAIKAVRPDIQLTAATLAWGPPSPEGYRATAGYQDACQDWPVWVERGLVDIAYVMHYKREGNADQAADYRGWFATFLSHRSPSSGRIVIGQGAFLNDAQGTMAQIQDATTAGFDGVAVFSYRVPSSGKPDRAAFGQALRDGPFQSAASRAAASQAVDSAD